MSGFRNVAEAYAVSAWNRAAQTQLVDFFSLLDAKVSESIDRYQSSDVYSEPLEEVLVFWHGKVLEQKEGWEKELQAATLNETKFYEEYEAEGNKIPGVFIFKPKFEIDPSQSPKMLEIQRRFDVERTLIHMLPPQPKTKTEIERILQEYGRVYWENTTEVPNDLSILSEYEEICRLPAQDIEPMVKVPLSMIPIISVGKDCRKDNDGLTMFSNERDSDGKRKFYPHMVNLRVEEKLVAMGHNLDELTQGILQGDAGAHNIRGQGMQSTPGTTTTAVPRTTSNPYARPQPYNPTHQMGGRYPRDQGKPPPGISWDDWNKAFNRANSHFYDNFGLGESKTAREDGRTRDRALKSALSNCAAYTADAADNFVDDDY